MPGSLENLKKHRKDLLLAEVAAWLHDYRKCSDENIAVQAIPKDNHAQGLPRNYIDSLLPDTQLKLMFLQPQNSVSISDLIKEGNKTTKFRNESLPWPIRVLCRCHGAAHIEKEEPSDDKDSGKQPADDTRPSTPFGYEGLPLKNLTTMINALPYDRLTERTVFERKVRSTFRQALGDTRRPINEVTLWDWAHIVAALFKAALAGILLTQNTPDPGNLKWRLLALRFDGCRVVDRVPSIQALLARREWVKKGLDNVKRLLEEDYPLGTEVYRDSNGSLFVVPDVPDLLEYTTSENRTLKSLIQEKMDSVFEGELVITPELDTEAWWAQHPDWNKNYSGIGDAPPPIAKLLEKTKSANPDWKRVRGWWDTSQAEPCRISGVRPQGPGAKAKERKLSDFWFERTGKRSEEWAGKPETTIWISEVADINGRVALIAAKLELENWLKPDGLVNTLLVTLPNQDKSIPARSKTPSFARMRRFWETAASFWENEVHKKLGSLIGTIGPRIIIKGDLDNLLAHYLAYEIHLKPGIKLEVVWVEQKLIVITNLGYIAKLLGAEEEDYFTPDKAAQWLREYLRKKEKLLVYEPDASSKKDKPVACLKNIKVEIQEHNYLPAISVLSEPHQCMVLVPADKALSVARHIKTEYEVQFSKVKNRLPLHLNLVFFGRKEPLYVAIDAARRMLTRTSPLDTAWMVEAIGQAEASEICRHSKGRLGNRVIKLKLRRKTDRSGLPPLNDRLETMISYSTGSPDVEDCWYPYLFVASPVSDGQGKDYRLCFKAPLPGRGEMIPLVHVKELKEGDKVYYAPSTFDFEFLDVSARRFELVYDEVTGMRWPSPRAGYATRPFLLEDVDIIEDLWAFVIDESPIRQSKSQLRQITELIETKRADWRVFCPNDTLLSKLADQVLRRSFGKLWSKIQETHRERLISWVASGRWRDLIELYLSIIKLPGNELSDKSNDRGL